MVKNVVLYLLCGQGERAPFTAGEIKRPLHRSHPLLQRDFVRDKVVAIILIVLVLEVSRRTVGLAMSIIAGVFIIYAFLGGYMPAMLMHRGFTLNKLVDCLYLTTEGFFGSMTAICAGTLFVFISFGVFLQETGGDKRFMDIALSVAGHKPGGPAKVAVLSSGCMGMISGRDDRDCPDYCTGLLHDGLLH